jgi:hypothetical protein
MTAKEKLFETHKIDGFGHCGRFADDQQFRFGAVCFSFGALGLARLRGFCAAGGHFGDDFGSYPGRHE